MTIQEIAQHCAEDLRAKGTHYDGWMEKRIEQALADALASSDKFHAAKDSIIAQYERGDGSLEKRIKELEAEIDGAKRQLDRQFRDLPRGLLEAVTDVILRIALAEAVASIGARHNEKLRNLLEMREREINALESEIEDLKKRLADSP